MATAEIVPNSSNARQRLDRLDQLRSMLSEVVRGKGAIIERLLLALLAEGSVLIEDVPGVGKTTLAKAFAIGVGLHFHRVQCTPDILPADVIGFSVYRPDTGELRFQPGPVFCNLLLLDEINRASPRTQSALLEAMAERQVTVEGVRRELESPFFVVATQNPSGFEGTFPLPESQLDRFLFKLAMEYPEATDEVEMLLTHVGGTSLSHAQPILTAAEIRAMQQATREVHVSRRVSEYLVDVVRRTRQSAEIRLGASPRGSIMLLRACQARALVAGRNYVLPDDVQELAVDVLSHRLITNDLEYADNNDSRRQAQDANRQRVAEIVKRTPVPVGS